eukprot:2139654-Alexandrium_andersonii.AAC.1
MGGSFEASATPAPIVIGIVVRTKASLDCPLDGCLGTRWPCCRAPAPSSASPDGPGVAPRPGGTTAALALGVFLAGSFARHGAPCVI